MSRRSACERVAAPVSSSFALRYNHILTHNKRQCERVLDELGALARCVDVRGNIRLLGQIALAHYFQRAIERLAVAEKGEFALVGRPLSCFLITLIGVRTDMFDFGRYKKRRKLVLTHILFYLLYDKQNASYTTKLSFCAYSPSSAGAATTTRSQKCIFHVLASLLRCVCI